MKKLIYLIIPMIMLFLVSCDSRNNDNPTINVVISKDKIYTIGNYEEAEVTITLTGKDSQTKNARVNVEYDHDLITIMTNSADISTFITDEYGQATGTIIAKRVPGNVNLDFIVDKWHSSHQVKSIIVSDPEIINFVVSPDTLHADNQTLANIAVEVYPPLLTNYCYFTTTLGTLTADSTQFVSLNTKCVANNSIKSLVPGRAYITAKLKDYLNVSKTFEVLFN